MPRRGLLLDASESAALAPSETGASEERGKEELRPPPPPQPKQRPRQRTNLPARKGEGRYWLRGSEDNKRDCLDLANFETTLIAPQ